MHLLPFNKDFCSFLWYSYTSWVSPNTFIWVLKGKDDGRNKSIQMLLINESSILILPDLLSNDFSSASIGTEFNLPHYLYHFIGVSGVGLKGSWIIMNG